MSYRNELEEYKAVLLDLQQMMEDQTRLVNAMDQQQDEIETLNKENEKLLASLQACSKELQSQNEENQKLHEQNQKLLQSLKNSG